MLVINKFKNCPLLPYVTVFKWLEITYNRTQSFNKLICLIMSMLLITSIWKFSISNKKDSEKTKTKTPGDVESVTAVRLKSSDLVGRRGTMVGRICGTGASRVWNGRERWCDGGDRWWTSLMEWSRKIIPKTRRCIPEWLICDFEWARWGWTSNGDERWRLSAARRLNSEQRSGYGDKQVEQ